MIKDYKLYLIDLDGTIYNGEEIIAYAREFIDYLNDRQIDYLFLTNNSTKIEADVLKKLTNLGIKTTCENIYTSSQATATYLKHKQIKKVFCIGEAGLKNTLIRNGLELVDYMKAQAVVVGLDRSLTYEKLTKACLAIKNGALLVGTNPDKLIPTELGLAPSNGGQVKYLEYATDTTAVIIGKPEKIIMDMAIEKFAYPKEAIAMIGDNYDTDILSGINAGIDTIHVATGVTSKEIVLSKKQPPTYTISNLKELIDH